MTEHQIHTDEDEPTLSLEELDADAPNDNLAGSLLLAKAERIPSPSDREWDTATDALLARLEKERPAPRERSRVVWLAFAGAMAAAAAALLVFNPPASTPTANPTTTVARQDAAGSLTNANGATVTASGVKVENGYALKTGDSLSVNGGNAVFSQDGKVRFSVESGSEVKVAQANAPLILALAIGATEADVTPVPTGDAFAVDVTSANGAVARVAVHGTHLRVTRKGDHVVVDVTEGVISVGAASGGESTLVHAPAHVEFEATDAAHTVVVNRAADSVRAADTAVHQGNVVAPPATQAANHPPAHPTTNLDPLDTSGSKPLDTAPVVDAEQALSQEVRNCVVAVPSSTQVSLTVESKLTLRLADDGTVQNARFTPPLPADAQDCAARAIYKKGLFSHGGDVAIPLTVRR
ncbi:hypothetical protein BH09MYX1_BH09MYX1_05160 [soil metagenome]